MKTCTSAQPIARRSRWTKRTRRGRRSTQPDARCPKAPRRARLEDGMVSFTSATLPRAEALNLARLRLERVLATVNGLLFSNNRLSRSAIPASRRSNRFAHPRRSRSRSSTGPLTGREPVEQSRHLLMGFQEQSGVNRFPPRFFHLLWRGLLRIDYFAELGATYG